MDELRAFDTQTEEYFTIPAGTFGDMIVQHTVEILDIEEVEAFDSPQ